MNRPGVRMYSSAQSLTDPPGSSVIASGVAWVEGAALGSVATAIAIIAVAAIGLLMLSGRLDLRRGITVIFGCFLLFGASGIAAALTGLRSEEHTSELQSLMRISYAVFCLK